MTACLKVRRMSRKTEHEEVKEIKRETFIKKFLDKSHRQRFCYIFKSSTDMQHNEYWG